MIEKSGDENLLKRKVDDGENVKEKKKKKKIAKSYLDDLWIMNIKTNKCNKFLPNFVTNVPLAMRTLDFFNEISNLGTIFACLQNHTFLYPHEKT